jgi:hypothetical protein
MIKKTPTMIEIVLPNHFGKETFEIDPPAISDEKNFFEVKAVTIATQPRCISFDDRASF